MISRLGYIHLGENELDTLKDGLYINRIIIKMDNGDDPDSPILIWTNCSLYWQKTTESPLRALFMGDISYNYIDGHLVFDNNKCYLSDSMVELPDNWSSQVQNIKMIEDKLKAFLRSLL